eukprot:CAMPEP_0175816276 /NCGR_PEP_ID=MMETSP0107_2-20121207/6413_1 /TAXON_ID=195067 ORGANISM="Goniomonas pacifica, Strain CCMP1869" /NCGR_SAMPLE_ID=MMETSP0107_2 /ASSEMBLY_ACC=CAM_ASM_000203 /LENGTH=148 /DNA_ID=CAMNT_0017128373 /DNA_START=106 /DNA_END=552 /DNA_ORIENTATION=+
MRSKSGKEDITSPFCGTSIGTDTAISRTSVTLATPLEGSPSSMTGVVGWALGVTMACRDAHNRDPSPCAGSRTVTILRGKLQRRRLLKRGSLAGGGAERGGSKEVEPALGWSNAGAVLRGCGNPGTTELAHDLISRLHLSRLDRASDH